MDSFFSRGCTNELLSYSTSRAQYQLSILRNRLHNNPITNTTVEKMLVYNTLVSSLFFPVMNVKMQVKATKNNILPIQKAPTANDGSIGEIKSHPIYIITGNMGITHIANMVITIQMQIALFDCNAKYKDPIAKVEDNKNKRTNGFYI
ncbi:unnamed protein product [Paramecium octaurelia]|uniref:Uncharacterized protein n=1 Tax=Paramecium octaurelia TaxID=43137 RepID=A0A8S1Y9N9_PAROT|nr:unnamed protein product [Paramecium octaurelia]